jgi:hypothetical protein
MSSNKESELVIFAKVGDFKGFEQAEQVIEQIQLERFIPGAGRVRVRQSTSFNGSSIECTIKTTKKADQAGVLHCAEENAIVTPGFMETFRHLAEKCFVKKRYLFTGKGTTVNCDGQDYHLPPVIYEVDLFQRHDGENVPWVKIDIEVNKLMDAISAVPELRGKEVSLNIDCKKLPFVPQEAFIQGEDNTPEQKQLVKTLWEKEYAQHPMGGPIQEPTASIQPSAEPSQDGSDVPPSAPVSDASEGDDDATREATSENTA